MNTPPDTLLIGIYKDNPVSRAIADKWFRVNTQVNPHLYWWKLRSSCGKILVLAANEKTRKNREEEIKRDGYEILNYHNPETTPCETN